MQTRNIFYKLPAIIIIAIMIICTAGIIVASNYHKIFETDAIKVTSNTNNTQNDTADGNKQMPVLIPSTALIQHPMKVIQPPVILPPVKTQSLLFRKELQYIQHTSILRILFPLVRSHRMIRKTERLDMFMTAPELTPMETVLLTMCCWLAMFMRPLLTKLPQEVLFGKLC